jgi:predicted phosphodiesterase
MRQGLLFIFFSVLSLSGIYKIITTNHGSPIIKVVFPKDIVYTDGKTLRFHVLGDFGELHPHEEFPELPCKRVARKMNEQASLFPISMIVSVGDNFYPKPEEKLLDEVIKVFKIFFKGEKIKDVPWFLIDGNHDLYRSRTIGKDIRKNYKNVKFPNAPWNMTILMKNFSISFTFLPCDLICHGPYMNYVFERQCIKMKAKRNFTLEYSWIENHFAEISEDQSIKWKVVVIHYPIFSVSTTGLDSENLKHYLLPLINKYKIDLLLTGHNHNMQYFSSDFSQTIHKSQGENLKCLEDSRIPCNKGFLICSSKTVTCNETGVSCKNVISRDESFGKLINNKKIFIKGKEVHQIIQGAGGADLDPMCPDIDSPMAEYEFGLSDHGFTEVEITENRIQIKFIRANDSKVVFESVIEDFKN